MSCLRSARPIHAHPTAPNFEQKRANDSPTIPLFCVQHISTRVCSGVPNAWCQ